MQILKPKDLNAHSAAPDLTFDSTADLLADGHGAQQHAWVAQAEAKKAAMFGLNLPHSGFNLLVLGAQGSGRSSLMQSAMLEVARDKKKLHALNDLAAICAFEDAQLPTLMKLPVGRGAELREAMEQFSRNLIAEMSRFVSAKTPRDALKGIETRLQLSIEKLTQHITRDLSDTSVQHLCRYLRCVKQETLQFLGSWQPPVQPDNEGLESLLNEAFMARLRVNVLVDSRVAHAQGLHQPVVYDNDPSLQSLFGAVESASDAANTPEFLRLRAGNLHKADGGMLLLHLRDLLSDEASGPQIVEKLHRFLRNGTLQIEDTGGGTQNSSVLQARTLLPLQVKLVLIATREDFYDCLDQNPDFFEHFPIKVEFAERILANAENHAAIAGFVAQKCVQHGARHFTAGGVAALINAMQRYEEDQRRISASFARLESLMLESAAYAADEPLVTEQHVQNAILARSARHAYFEGQIRDSIIDNELLIQVHGAVVGQVNGLTHIELGDASFGSPIRITARCYPGAKGLINIDREVNMSGPNHDKGIFILQNWLSASFSRLAPLSLNASLVFEQEYNGVEGDSASCAELFALLSALAGLPIQQGVAVTGALNQFGEVMPIGGLNEKIEGYFRVCQALGLDGKQGVMIPKRNQQHLLLNSAVIDAVKAGKFTIVAIDHVLEGIAFLTGIPAGIPDSTGHYEEDTVMGKAQAVLAQYRTTFENNQQRFGVSLGHL